MNTTSIQWTDKSLNPIRAKRRDGTNRVPGHYCQKISSGCANCYASNTQIRFGMPAFPGTKGTPETDGVEVYLDEKVLASVLRCRKPCRIFWCDMTDMFGAWVPFEWIDKCFAVMALTPHLTHQVLTKRPERMAEYLLSHEPFTTHPICNDAMWEFKNQVAPATFEEQFNSVITRRSWPLPNVWLGTSIENRDVLARADELRKCPAAIRFLSLEPLIGSLGEIDLSGIGWVIVGGESGPGARSCNVEWIRSIIAQCAAADVPCFVKQLGAYSVDNSKPIRMVRDGENICMTHDPKGGEPSEWEADLRVRQFPRPPVEAQR